MVPRGVRGVDPACRCHQSNIMPDSFFSVNIPQWVTCLLFVLFCFMCVLRGDILGSFCSQRQGDQFYHYYINGLGETLIYNGIRQIELISFKRGSLFGAFVCGFQTTNFIWGFQCCIWYIARQPGILKFQSMQPTRQDVATEF